LQVECNRKMVVSKYYNPISKMQSAQLKMLYVTKAQRKEKLTDDNRTKLYYSANSGHVPTHSFPRYFCHSTFHQNRYIYIYIYIYI